MSADYHDYAELQSRLVGVAEELNAMAADVAKARQVVEYDSDRRKRALAVAAMPFINGGRSSAAADTEARASDDYAKAMGKLGTEYAAAQTVLTAWEAKKILFESNRSLLSAHKTTIANL